MRAARFIGLFVVAIMALASQARASEFVTSTGGYPAGGLRDGFAWTSNDYAGTLGYSFTVGPQNLVVTALGYYDGPNSAAANIAGYLGDGLNNAHQVGIWDTTTNQDLLTSATVPAGTGATLVDDFRYVTVAPITLLANTTYTVGGQVTVADNSGTPGAGDVFRNGGASGDTFGPGIASVSGSPSFTGPTINPSFNDGVFQAPNRGGNGYFGGSFQYSVVAPTPEPSSFVLGGFGVAALYSAARRRRKPATL